MIPLPSVEENFYETKTSQKMSVLFKNFFDKSDEINKKFKKNKRAYLLYSDPGMGKSALIRHFCKKSLEIDGTAIIHTSGEVDFNKITNIFLKPYAKDVTRIILVIEDFGKRDYGSNSSIVNPSCLNFLDGVAGLFRVPTLILCTTNFIKELGPQLTNRPGRFSKLIRVLPPSDDDVFSLIEGVSGLTLTDKQKAAFRGLKMSPDHIIEALVRYELEDVSLESAAQEVLQERVGLTQWK
jgi:SpoVK/Ycf46/Vps4 family AAA+-type ATPase